MNVPLILQAVLDQYTLPWGGEHGVAHWARVLENGLRLAEETGANVEVVRRFGILHDSRRVNEATDPDHGARAAEFARSLRGRLLDLPDRAFLLLHRAYPRADAPRRDGPDLLGRRSPRPRACRHHTASEPALHRGHQEGRDDPVGQRWATFRVVPQFVRGEWRIDLGDDRSWTRSALNPEDP